MRSGQSVYSNTNSQHGGSDHDYHYGGGGDGGGSERGSSISGTGVDSGGARRSASWSTKARAHPLPRGLRVHGNGDVGEGFRGEMGDEGYDDEASGYGGVAALGGPPGAERTNGGAASYVDGGVGSNSTRRRGSKTHTAATRRTDGSVSDIGGGAGAGSGGRGRSNLRSSSRTMLRTMSLRGRTFFAGGSANAPLGERRSVSMSSFRGRGDSARSGGGDYDGAGGGRGVANRVCSALSVSWLFTRKRSKGDAAPAATPTAFRRKGSSKSSGSSRGTGNGSGSGSRRTTAFSGGGVIGVVDAGGGDGSSSDEAEYDGDVFEIGGPLDIAVGGVGPGGGRRSYGAAAAAAAGLGPGGGGGGVDDGSSLPSADGGTPGGSSIGTAASGSFRGAKRMSFTRSAFLGFNRNAHR